MTEEEFKALGEKVGNNTATAEERIAFMTELNSLITGMRSDLAEAKNLKDNN